MSTDFKVHADGIEMIHRALPSIGKDIIDVMDILLRCWNFFLNLLRH